MTKLIIVEGIDGCGKTTLIKNLENSFSKSEKVITFQTPICDEFRKPIRSILKTGNLFDIEGYDAKMASDGTYVNNTLDKLSVNENFIDSVSMKMLTELFIADKILALSPGGPIYEAIQNNYDYIILDRFVLSMNVYNKKYLSSSVKDATDLIHTLLSSLDIDTYTILIDLSASESIRRLKFRKERNSKENDGEIFDNFKSLRENEMNFINISNDLISNRVNEMIYDDEDLIVTSERRCLVPAHYAFNIVVNGNMPETSLLSFVSAGIALCNTFKEERKEGIL